MVEIDEPLEITTIGDVPAGTGMGSSSSLTVGLLNALYAYRAQSSAASAWRSWPAGSRSTSSKKPIGRQDQYAAAFGGLNYIRFNPDDTVDVEPVPCRAETLDELERRTLLLYTGQTRDANEILEQQSERHRRPHGRAPPDARPGRRDAAGPGRRRRPRRASPPCCTRAGS